MLHGIMKFWRDLTCEDDGNTTYCPVRVGGMASLLAHFGASGYQLVIHGSYDAVQFATACSAIIGVTAGGVAAKARFNADHV